VVGSKEETHYFRKLIIANSYHVGGTVNPLASDLITCEGEKSRYNSRFKNFTTTTAISDLIVLEGPVDSRPPEERISTIVPTAEAGIAFCYTWDNTGLRLTEPAANVKVLAMGTSLRITAGVFQVTRVAGYTKQSQTRPVLARGQDAYAA
jgi:hypothetical protein